MHPQATRNRPQHIQRGGAGPPRPGRRAHVPCTCTQRMHAALVCGGRGDTRAGVTRAWAPGSTTKTGIRRGRHSRSPRLAGAAYRPKKRPSARASTTAAAWTPPGRRGRWGRNPRHGCAAAATRCRRNDDRPLCPCMRWPKEVLRQQRTAALVSAGAAGEGRVPARAPRARVCAGIYHSPGRGDMRGRRGGVWLQCCRSGSLGRPACPVVHGGWCQEAAGLLAG